MSKADPIIIDGYAVHEKKVLLPRAALVVDDLYNPRDANIEFDEEVRTIAASLDLHKQLTPLYATPLADGRAGVRDGYTRVKLVDLGKCPVFAARDEFKVILLHDGTAKAGATLNPLPERIVRRYCATINRMRRNWTELEEARYYQAEIDDAKSEALAKLNAERKTERKGPLKKLPEDLASSVHAQTIAQLAQEEDRTPVTIRDRMRLLQLPHSAKIALRQKLIRVSSAKEFLRVSDTEARAAIDGLVKEQGYILDWHALERRKLVLQPVSEKAEVAAPAAAAAEVSRNGRRGSITATIPDPTKHAGSMKPEDPEKPEGEDPEPESPAADGDGDTPKEKAPAPKTSSAESNGAAPHDEPVAASKDDVARVRRNIKPSRVRAQLQTGGKGKPKTAPERQKAGGARKRRSDSEIEKAITHYENLREAADESRRENARFAVRLLRYVVGETSRLP